MGIGAKVSIHPAGKPELLGHREIATGYGYASGQTAIAHFGLGKTAAVDVRVEFPDGTEVHEKNVKADQLIEIAIP